MKYHRHDMHGLLVVDKPPGASSMDVVRIVRRAAGHCKTGHAGTLDPLASGVVICCLGKATRAVEQLMALEKEYEATIDLSAWSTTDDLEGELQPVDVDSPPTLQDVESALRALTGVIQQRPPIHSAIQIKGRRAYKMARKGHDVQLEPRPVRIDRIDLLEYDWPRLRICVVCGKGTYIRSLARQIGQALNTGGLLTALRRTRIGPYRAEDAASLDDLPATITQTNLLPAPSGT